MTVPLRSPATALGLLLWGALAIALARRAETTVSLEAPPRPWSTGAAVLVVTLLASVSRPAAEAALCGAACIGLVAAAATDARTGYLFDAVTFPCALLTSTLAIVAGRTTHAVEGVLLLVAPFGAVVACSRGRWMGLGDVKAMFAVGVAFGPFESLVAIAAACFCAIASAVLSNRTTRNAEIRFGPHLAVGAVLTLVAGRSIARILGASD